jgi:aspartyl-tRNA(Asn)/glutamyl-tRNA(Gln) amidotransferase subunit C
MLNIDEVKHVAHLARLDLTPKELKLYSGQLAAVLSYIDQLSEVDTSGVSLSTEISGPANVWREDEVKDWSDEENQLALKQFSEIKNKQLQVPRVLE